MTTSKNITETHYTSSYNNSLLNPVPRHLTRQSIQITPDKLPFIGEDIWNGYELSYLNPKGKPVVGICEFRFPCESPFLIESKSFKLYLFSFHQSKFSSKEEVENILQKDLKNASQARYVGVKLVLCNEPEYRNFSRSVLWEGINLDELDVEVSCYDTNPELLKANVEEITKEVLTSELLKSNCPLTGQPDYGSVLISYEGPKIDHVSLLQYIISYRMHNGFHEQCVEQMFAEIMRKCKPTNLGVYTRFTRRGGMDINPYRFTNGFNFAIQNVRLPRQ